VEEVVVAVPAEAEVPVAPDQGLVLVEVLGPGRMAAFTWTAVCSKLRR
jgi:hypothetical protein